ncbi:MAG: zf-HC2 domain-containing protein [Oscillospiraceae bacterium]|nr:zf-HC2 domain-containing protein [Oscillospiraceae bacterium]
MGCEYYLELISAQLDGELTEEERAALTEHLSSCENCRRIASAFSAIRDGITEEAEVPAGFAASVMARLPAKKKKVITLRRWGSLAAAAVLVVALGSYGARLLAPKGGAAPASGADMAAPAAEAPAAAEPQASNEMMMFAAPRMDVATAEEAPAMECAETEAGKAAAFDPRQDAALLYAAEKRPGHWEILSDEEGVITLRHESGEELALTVDENGVIHE